MDNWFARIWNWTCDPAHQWRSWMAHTVLVVLIAMPFGVQVAIAFYFLREVQDYAVHRWVDGLKTDWRDDICDFAFPAMGLGIMAAIFGWH